MPYAPVLNTAVPQAITAGFQGFSDAIQRQQQMRQQQAQFEAVQAQRAAEADLGYYTNEADLGYRYSALGQQIAESQANRGQRQAEFDRTNPVNWAGGTTISKLPTGEKVIESQTSPYSRRVEVVEPALPLAEPTTFPIPGIGNVVDLGNGKREFVPPRVDPAARTSDADVAAQAIADVGKARLKNLRELVKKFGPAEQWDGAAKAQMGTLAREIARLKIKITDPTAEPSDKAIAGELDGMGIGSVFAREEKVLGALDTTDSYFDAMLQARKAARGEPSAAAAAGAPSAAPAVDPNAAYLEARQAISRGANREAVKARLKQMGLDPNEV